MQLATCIRSHRQNIGMTQKQLAESVGVTDVTISRWESGQRDPVWYQFVKLCEVLGINPLDFMDIQKSSDISGVKTITVPKINIDNAMTYKEYARNVGKLEKENEK